MFRFWGFSPRRGDTLHRSRWNWAWRGLLVRSSLPNFTLIGSGVGFTAPKTEKKWNFTNIIAPKGRVPCMIFTKFTGFMRLLSLHNFTKFRCYISINGKIINNLPRWGVFSQIFDFLAAKLLIGSKKHLDLKWWHGPPVSPCKTWWKSLDARRRERMKCDVFYVFCVFCMLLRLPLPVT